MSFAFLKQEEMLQLTVAMSKAGTDVNNAILHFLPFLAVHPHSSFFSSLKSYAPSNLILPAKNSPSFGCAAYPPQQTSQAC